MRRRRPFEPLVTVCPSVQPGGARAGARRPRRRLRIPWRRARRPAEGDELYDDEGHVLYGALAATSLFKAGIDALEARAKTRRVAIMCSEEDPTDCHRRLLVTRVLQARDVLVDHIRGDGRAQSEADLEPAAFQQSLFAEEKPWRSTRSVLHRQPRATSSTG